MLITLAILAVASHSWADSIKDNEIALAAIINTAERICSVVKTEGSSEGIKVAGNVKVELDGLFKRLAKLGIGGQTSIDSSTYQGVLQKDLPTALHNMNLCRLQVFDKLQQKLIPSVRENSRQGASTPLSMTLLASETNPLDGYHFVGTPELPADLAAGVILPGGGRTRLVLQAADPDRIAIIDRIRLVVGRRDLAEHAGFNYAVDPVRQSGFGAARPRRFYIRVPYKERADAFYINEANATKPIGLNNILVGTNFPLLVFDRSAGLQETLDFAFVVTKPGLYDIHFIAHATSQGQEYEIQSESFYIVRH
jgi:hypothetical protein